MKKITAVYFSPCGTTKTAVCSVAGGLGEVAKEVDLTPLSAASTEISLDAEDVLVCGVPSFGGRVPLTALERIKNLHGNGTAAVAVVTYGNRAFDKGMGMLFTNISFWIILLYFATPSLPGWATKNWLPTLFSENLSIDMSEAGPLSTITIALSSFIGVIAGGILSDKWIQTNVRGRVYTGAIGLALTIPSLLLLGFGHNFLMIVGGGLCFGIGFGIFDANNMPILCQFISPRYRATAYGIMNMTGVFAGAAITDLLGRSTDAGNLGHDFAMLAGLVAIALLIQICFLRPKVANMTD